MLPAVVLSLSTRVRADWSCLFVYKSMLNPGGKAIVSKGRFSVCAAVYADRTHTHIHNRRDAEWLKAILPCLIDGCSKVHRYHKVHAKVCDGHNAAMASLAALLRSALT